MTTRLLDGKCECGAVRYRVSDEFLYAANCHCSNCRIPQSQCRSDRYCQSSQGCPIYFFTTICYNTLSQSEYPHCAIFVTIHLP